MNGQQYFLRIHTKHACFLVDIALLLEISFGNRLAFPVLDREPCGLSVYCSLAGHGPASLAKVSNGSETVVSGVPFIMTRSGSGFDAIGSILGADSSYAGCSYMRLRGDLQNPALRCRHLLMHSLYSST